MLTTRVDGQLILEKKCLEQVSRRFLVGTEFCPRQKDSALDFQLRPLVSPTLKFHVSQNKMCSGLRSCERGDQVLVPPSPIHRAGYVAFKTLQTLMEKCDGVPSCKSNICLWIESRTACNKMGRTCSKNLAGSVSTFLFSAYRNGMRSYVNM